MKLRILMLVFNAVGYGTYWRAWHLARCLAERGHRLTLVAMNRVREPRFKLFREQGVTVIAAPDLFWGSLRSGWDPYAMLMRTLWLAPHQYDVVHSFECRPTALIPAVAVARRSAALLLTDWCDWFGAGGSVEERPNRLQRMIMRPLETFFEERFRAAAAGTTVISSTLYHKTLALGVPPERILRLHAGADVEAIRPGDRAAARQLLRLPATAPIVGYLGQIFPRDAQLMAASFDALRNYYPNARLLLIGNLDHDIAALSAHPAAIIRTGSIAYEQLNPYLAACDICWLPLCDSGANRGRWPLKLNDYMAAGRATAATAVGDVTEVMETFPIGMLARDNPADLARVAAELLTDVPNRIKMEQTARMIAEQVFDWRFQAADLEHFYRQLR
ncbi:MAG: glycosyltransferase family 4 protein [Oscillochloris sp.]|nr:glycosyltransferase family 4 protein [Oscillochloris sp.]